MLPAVLAMKPRYVDKMWAGARLRHLPGKHRHPPPQRTGESWEVADIPEGSSVVDGGPLDGMTLRAVAQEFGQAFVGQRCAAGADGVLRFPLLVKLLDAGDDLSVQVHPDDAYARAHPGTFSKDEAWLVVACEPGAKVLHGTRDDVDRMTFERALRDGSGVARLLREVRVSVGDVLRIQPGTLHAVGKGCVLLEVQEPSDTTFRVDDYGRLDNGKLRPLHIEQALAVARFGSHEKPLVADAISGQTAIRTAKYSMAFADVDAAGAGNGVLIERDEGEPAVVFVLEGAVDVVGADGSIAQLERGATAIVSARAGLGDVRVRAGVPSTIVVMSTGR